MQTQNRLFDDLARVASGALHTLGGLKDEIEMRVRERLERLATEMNLVPREEFEAVRAMAQKAREEQERLAARLADLEAEVDRLRAAVSRRQRRGAASESPADDAATTPEAAPGDE
ncbi:hypothetical protein HRbin40_02631 [bacterium HR40]|nr:hypothetical protein HRbin40_02631 [bacterium HR40]